jgi:hypothetical protein
MNTRDRDEIEHLQSKEATVRTPQTEMRLSAHMLSQQQYQCEFQRWMWVALTPYAHSSVSVNSRDKGKIEHLQPITLAILVWASETGMRLSTHILSQQQCQCELQRQRWDQALTAYRNHGVGINSRDRGEIEHSQTVTVTVSMWTLQMDMNLATHIL